MCVWAPSDLPWQRDYPDACQECPRGYGRACDIVHHTCFAGNPAPHPPQPVDTSTPREYRLRRSLWRNGGSMSDMSQEAGWLQASDGKWHAPEQHLDRQLPPPPPSSSAPSEPSVTGVGSTPAVPTEVVASTAPGSRLPDGWHPDPFGLHQERLFKGGEPTPLVKDDGVGSYGALPTMTEPVSLSVQAPTPVGGAPVWAVSQSDVDGAPEVASAIAHTPTPAPPTTQGPLTAGATTLTAQTKAPASVSTSGMGADFWKWVLAAVFLVLVIATIAIAAVG
jgi:hypothetical protein